MNIQRETLREIVELLDDYKSKCETELKETLDTSINAETVEILEVEVKNLRNAIYMRNELYDKLNK